MRVAGAYVVTGTLTDDRTVALDESLPPEQASGNPGLQQRRQTYRDVCPLCAFVAADCLAAAVFAPLADHGANLLAEDENEHDSDDHGEIQHLQRAVAAVGRQAEPLLDPVHPASSVIGAWVLPGTTDSIS